MEIDSTINTTHPVNISKVGEPIDDGQPLLLWYRYDLAFGTALAIAYGLVFIVGLIGNVLVIIAVYSGFGGRSMRHSVTNVLLANLAVADLLVIIACLPFTLISNIIYRKLKSTSLSAFHLIELSKMGQLKFT